MSLIQYSSHETEYSLESGRPSAKAAKLSYERHMPMENGRLESHTHTDLSHTGTN